MDMRTKAYPALPEGRDLRLVLPRVGDLRFRPQVPSAFAQRLYIHADPRRRFWYARFQLKRKFVVMSTQGDLYANTTVASLTMADLPRGNVLNMPRVARGDLVKVLDLVQCSRSEGQRWELVFTRWRNGMETWLPLEVVQLFAPELLQEFYVNSINSWAFHNRVQSGTLAMFRTEVELWLFHPEFQEFYKKLRQKRAGGNAAQQQVRVKPEVVTPVAASIQPTPTPPVPQPPASQTPAEHVRSDPSETVIQEFEQRRLATERREQLDRTRRNQLVQLQQQQHAGRHAEEQRRLEHEREERLRPNQETQERERRTQHEWQRQKAHEELQRRQKEYQQRLRAQQEREKLMEVQKQKEERLQRVKEQEKLRKRLQQKITLQEQSSRKKAPQGRHRPDPLTQQKNNGSKSQQPKERNSIWTKGGDDEYVPPEESESEDNEDSDASFGSESSEDSLSNQRTQKRRRKRLLYSQVDLDDEDDDFPDLSQPPPSTRQRKDAQNSSEDEAPSRKHKQSSKKRKRSHQPSQSKDTSSNVEVDLTQLSDGSEENDGEGDNVMEPKTAPVSSNGHTGKEKGEINGDENSIGSSELAGDIEDGSDADADDDMNFEASMVIGEIRCACGSTSVGGYRGQWLQCWKEDCGVWEHADCVGFLTNSENYPPSKYLCSRCDSQAYLARCIKASQRILDWLFQCCHSRNLKLVMELLKDNTGATNLPADWKNENFENRTLAMHAARNGLVECLSYLLDERKVDIFATDLQSRNVLHHAALGGSINCCRVLLKHDRKLLLHQDLRGCMPFHCMLQSANVNRLCIAFMREDAALVGMADLDSNFPIHYACQAVNRYSVKICQLIFSAQPSMLQEKSGEGLYPLMILCRAAGPTATNLHKAVSEVAKSAKDIIALSLDLDVFGDCLNQKASNGWSPLHFAAAAGNHELVTYLCKTELFDVHKVVKETGQTALHIAAQENHPLCVRALLLEGLNVVAKDSDGWIPMLYTVDATCVQEFMHHKLTKQLSRLHRMLGKYQERELVRRWQRCVARDPTCFDILNDWCQSDTERIERMEGLLLSNPFLLRLDNRIEYVRKYIIPSIKHIYGEISIVDKRKAVGEQHSRPQPKTLAFVFSRPSGCFWKQFVGMAKILEPEDFRFPIVFSIKRSGTSTQGVENRESNLKLVLIRLAAGLYNEVPGLLIRGSGDSLEKTPLTSDKEKSLTQLLDYFLLGELVAHFVLYSVPLSGILDFAPAFLRCIGCKGRYTLAGDEPWETVGRSFTAGFEAVLPVTLELFHGDGLRVLFNGPETSLNALQIEWSVAVDWKMGDNEVESAKEWLPRLISELVEEEQQLLLLFMTGTYQLVNERFFRSDGGSDRITIESYPEADNILDQDKLYPMMEHKPDVLRLPSYSGYAAFKRAMLTVIRHVDQAFVPE